MNVLVAGVTGAIGRPLILAQGGSKHLPMQRSSHLDLPDLHKSELLAEICHRLGATDYLSGSGAKTYLNREVFESVGMRVEWQSFCHPRYDQCWMRQGFLSNLSAVDLLANMGPRSAEVIRSTRHNASQIVSAT